MQANLEDTVEDDDALYQKLISKSIDADTSGPDSTSSRTSKGSIYLQRPKGYALLVALLAVSLEHLIG